jgi:hypothetical protein
MAYGLWLIAYGFRKPEYPEHPEHPEYPEK